ncbi:hypothetical protein BN2497_875 [Janthinobacterium sp. CG23_2]|nr:hypothetical protein BN2497_875 [Janthinobacterium sp. CG23_2]CUU26835.1 hypothetical protein BN3177_875 [Janthinobacterium sp. CG23_2]
MLGSHDKTQIGAALRMLEWRSNTATRHADILPALVALLADPVSANERDRIKRLILAFGPHAMVALPLFMAHAADPKANPHRPDVQLFVELIKHGPTPLDHLIDLIDSETASLDARMAAASHIGRSIPGAARAVPSLMRVIAMAQSQTTGNDSVKKMAGLLAGYLASEDPAAAADYLVALRARDPAGMIGRALDDARHSPRFEGRLVDLFDDPALAVAAVSTLGGMKFGTSRHSPPPPAAQVKLAAMLADPARLPTALEYLETIGGPMPGLAQPVFSYYEKLGKQEIAKRQQALHALEVTNGLSQQQLQFLVNQMVVELRAGYPLRKGRGLTPDILRLLVSAEPLREQSVPSLVLAFRLAGRPAKPFTAEQSALIDLIGRTRSAAGIEALARMLPPMPRARPLPPAWSADTNTVLGALVRAGDLVLPFLELQLERRSGIELALAESALVEMRAPASRPLLARHAARVSPALLATLAAAPAARMPVAGRPAPLDVNTTSFGMYCSMRLPESELGVALFRIARLGLATTPEVIEQLALVLDDDRADVRACAGAAILTAPSHVARPIVAKVAAMPGHPSAARMITTIDMEEARAGG